MHACMQLLIHNCRHAIRTLSPRLFATLSSFLAAASSRQRISAWDGMAESFVAWSTPKLDVTVTSPAAPMIIRERSPKFPGGPDLPVTFFEGTDAAFPMIVGN